MKTVLIVDEDAGALRALARLVSVRYRGVTVLTASTGEAAVAELRSKTVHVVLVELRLSDWDGLDLVTWMVTNVPQVLVIPMTVSPSPDTALRLTALGINEFLSKPIDSDVLSHVLNGALTSEIKGQIENVGLPSLLQLVELEKKTCKMIVRGGGEVGILQVVRGKLVHAETGNLEGDDAALEIASWAHPTIEFENQPPPRDRSVSHPLGFILMESARLQDEREAAESKRMAVEESGLPRAIMLRGERKSTNDVRSYSRSTLEAAANVDGILAVALVGVDGRLLDHVMKEPLFEMPKLAEGLASVVRAELLAVEQQGRADRLEDLLITSAGRYEMLRPLPGTESFVLVIGDRKRAAPAMTRLFISATEKQFCESALALAAGASNDSDFDLGF
jgi:ActR/RegA family two-component response regulator